MTTKIGLINYSLGNIGSIRSAFEFYEYDVRIIANPKEIADTDVLVLAGVGNFSTASRKLKELKFWDVLDEDIRYNKKPVLGVCLGMQMFSDMGCENGNHNGFGWIPGNVIKLHGNALRIPHIGWNAIIHNNNNPLFKGILSNYFYFMHSYHFVPKDNGIEIAWTQYGDQRFVSAIRKNNIVGVQFHPEKSQGDGLRVLKNFVEMMT